MNSGEMPWHKAGTKLDRPHTAQQAVLTAGLGWTAVKKERAAGKYVLVRDDLWNHKQNGILGAVRSNYIPLQNIEAFSFFDALVEQGTAVYDSAGTLGQGRWVWVMLRFPGDLEILPKDSIGRFLLFGNTPTTGHHRLAYLPVRLISRSTISGSYFHNPPPAISVPAARPRRFEESIEKATAQIDQQFRLLANRFRLMAGVDLNSEQMRRYLKAVFTHWTRKTTGLQSPHSVSEHEHDLTECSRLFVEAKGNDLRGTRGTLWAALGAIAEYVDSYKLKPSDPMYLNEIWFNELKGSALQVAEQMLASKLKKS